MKDITASVTVAMVAPLFPTTPRANIATNLPYVLKALSAAGMGGTDAVCVALGTIAAETGSFLPVPEGQSRFNTARNGAPFALYDFRHDLGNGHAGDGARFKGRGFVQLTGRANYAHFGPRLTPPVDLLAHPDLACAPEVAADLLALFIASKWPAMRACLDQDDLAGVRRLVNGGSHGLDTFIRVFEAAEVALPDGGD